MRLCCANLDSRQGLADEWLTAVAACGLAGVSLVGTGHQPPQGPPAGLQRLREHGLSVGAVELATTDVPAWLPWARDAGASHVVAVLGSSASADDPPPAALLEELARTADAAAAAGLTLCLDTAPGLGAHSRAMAQTLGALAHPALRLCFDTGRYQELNPGANGEVALQRVLGHLGCLRLTDVDENYQPPVPVPLGMGGLIDFARTLQIVRALEFAGPAIVSVPAAGQDGEAGRTAQREFLRECVQHLADCGWLND